MRAFYLAAAAAEEEKHSFTEAILKIFISRELLQLDDETVLEKGDPSILPALLQGNQDEKRYLMS